MLQSQQTPQAPARAAVEVCDDDWCSQPVRFDRRVFPDDACAYGACHVCWCVHNFLRLLRLRVKRANNDNPYNRFGLRRG
ncbi:hypothetical protein UC8_57880 [Roseimaritima ulvae]|uniref:Uncharacterized protein n=1 Tax=Roseimaritima ulvae TaxID=980254 RepID=A0A5B9QXE5_9BACT|nr:hypothetical protein UC8_57880 [Roseimaritima ulvae]